MSTKTCVNLSFFNKCKTSGKLLALATGKSTRIQQGVVIRRNSTNSRELQQVQFAVQHHGIVFSNGVGGALANVVNYESALVVAYSAIDYPNDQHIQGHKISIKKSNHDHEY